MLAKWFFDSIGGTDRHSKARDVSRCKLAHLWEQLDPLYLAKAHVLCCLEENDAATTPDIKKTELSSSGDLRERPSYQSWMTGKVASPKTAISTKVCGSGAATKVSVPNIVQALQV